MKPKARSQIILNFFLFLIAIVLVGCSFNKNGITSSRGETDNTDNPEIFEIDFKEVLKSYDEWCQIPQSGSRCNTCKELRETLKEKNINIYNHFIFIGPRGEWRPVKLKLTNCPNMVEPEIIENDYTKQEAQLRGISENIAYFLKTAEFKKLNQATPKEVPDNAQVQRTANDANGNGKGAVKPLVYIFIHGGLNSFDESKERMVRDLGRILTSNKVPEFRGAKNTSVKYYPLFLVWPTEIGTYIDALENYDQGRWDSPWYVKWYSPFRFVGRDLMDLVSHSFLTYPKSILRWAEGEFGKDEIYQCKNLFGSGGGDTQAVRLDSGWKNLFTCEEDLGETANHPDRLQETVVYWGVLPVRMLAVPLTDVVGRASWNNMLARSRFSVRRPCIDLGQQDQRRNCEKGVFDRFFYLLDHELKNNEKPEQRKDQVNNALQPEILLVGHSMGSIIASELIRGHSDLPYLKDVVFMAGAVSIREYLDSVQTKILERVEQIKKLNDGLKSLQTENDCFLEANTKYVRGFRDAGRGPTISRKSRSIVGNRKVQEEPKCVKENRSVGAEGFEQLKPRMPFHFYNLSLDVKNEQKEHEGFGALPVGSLLEYIDDMYETPSDFLERTIGKWSNVVSVYKVLPKQGGKDEEDNTEINSDSVIDPQQFFHFQKFADSCSSPLTHGAFAADLNEPPYTVDVCPHKERELKYWWPAFWRWSK